jgi:hypothetical protein
MLINVKKISHSILLVFVVAISLCLFLFFVITMLVWNQECLFR